MLAAVSGFIQPGWGWSFRQPYLPPELEHASALSHRVAAPGPVSLNQASLAELMTLPGVTQSVGLKLIRIRPLQGWQDLYRLPWLEQKQIQRLIEKIQPLAKVD
jgi:competence protein ComEA